MVKFLPCFKKKKSCFQVEVLAYCILYLIFIFFYTFCLEYQHIAQLSLPAKTFNSIQGNFIHPLLNEI